MKKILLALLITGTLSATTFEDYLKNEKLACEQDIKRCIDNIESELDMQIFYFLMGKKFELELITKEYNHE